MRETVIVEAVRTPVGKRNGGLSSMHAADLSAIVLTELVERTGIDPDIIDDVVWGCVSQVGDQSSNIGRYAVLAAGVVSFVFYTAALEGGSVTVATAAVILAESQFPQAKIPAVLDAIRAHQPQDDPLTMEATILRDADILEQLGAIGILRAVSKVGRDTRYGRFSDITPVLRKALAELPPKLRLKRARELAAPKLSVLAGFLQAVDAEASGLLF